MNQRINNEKTNSLMAFLSFFSWLLLGSSLFTIPLVVIGSQKTGLTIDEYANNMDLVNLHSYFPSTISQILAIIAFVVLFKKIVIDDAKQFKEKLLKYIIIIVVAAALMYCAMLLVDFIYEKIGLGDETSKNQEHIINALHGKQNYIVIIYTIIIAPIIEEVIFRKLLFNTLKQYTKIPVWGIVVIISAVFAFIHVTDMESFKFFPVYFVPAFIITSAYAMTKENLYVSIGLHSINNFISVLEILL